MWRKRPAAGTLFSCGITIWVRVTSLNIWYNTAHGTVKRPEPIDVVTCSVLKFFVYTMNLEKANIPQERIVDMIRKVFSVFYEGGIFKKLQ